MRKHSIPALAVLAALVAAQPVLADDDDDDAGAAPAAKAGAAEKPTRGTKLLPELILGSKDSNFDVSQKDFKLIPGQAYRWKITSAAGFEYKFKTDLFRDTWVNQIVIDDLEVHMNGAPAWLEFDKPGTISINFNTIRPGLYTWSVPDLEGRGMKGTITVK